MELSPKMVFRGLIGSMVLLSIYFTFDVQRRRSALRGSTASLSISDGDPIQIDTPIDGDELSVKHGEQTFTVRLLGVKAFEVSKEPGLGDPGQRAIDSLMLHNGQEGIVRFEKQAVDRSGRLLAHVEIDGEDLGHDLVEDGWALVYTKYPFPRMDAYLAVERKAMADRRGLWSSPKASERALKIRAGWEVTE